MTMSTKGSTTPIVIAHTIKEFSMNTFDVFKYGGVKQDDKFDRLLIDNLQSYISDGYHIVDYANKEFTDSVRGTITENKLSKVLLSNNNGSVVEIIATKNKFIDQITTYHYKTKRVKIKTSTTTLYKEKLV